MDPLPKLSDSDAGLYIRCSQHEVVQGPFFCYQCGGKDIKDKAIRQNLAYRARHLIEKMGWHFDYKNKGVPNRALVAELDMQIRNIVNRNENSSIRDRVGFGEVGPRVWHAHSPDVKNQHQNNSNSAFVQRRPRIEPLDNWTLVSLDKSKSQTIPEVAAGTLAYEKEKPQTDLTVATGTLADTLSCDLTVPEAKPGIMAGNPPGVLNETLSGDLTDEKEKPQTFPKATPGTLTGKPFGDVIGTYSGALTEDLAEEMEDMDDDWTELSTEDHIDNGDEWFDCSGY